MVPNAFQVFRSIEFDTKRTEPSHRQTLTPPECRLRAPAICELPAATGMSGSSDFWNHPFCMMSGAVELGVIRVWNRQCPSSFWMSPRQSLSLWLNAIRVSDIISVLEVPSVIVCNLQTFGLFRLPLASENGAIAVGTAPLVLS